MKTKHTPGPWKLELVRWAESAPISGFGISAEGKTPWLCSAGASERANHCTVVADEHIEQGVTTGFSASEAEANARLIAAAPELLAALSGMIGLLDANAYALACKLGTQGHDDEPEPESIDGFNRNPRIERARATIAKAEGRT